MTGEAARVASKGKLYGDRLKSALAAKCHLNNLMSMIAFFDDITTKSISVPVVQIMRLNTHVFILKLASRGICAHSKKYDSFAFKWHPTALRII